MLSGVRVDPRDEWCALMEKRTTCFSPVLNPAEAPHAPHHRARNAFIERAGVRQPGAPTPRFSRTRSAAEPVPTAVGEHTLQVLAEAGYSKGEIETFKRESVLG